MKEHILIFGLLYLTSSIAVTMAAPTSRRLPSRIVDLDEKFLVMRDHQVKDDFFLVPKEMEVVKQSVLVFGKERDNCAAAEDFQATENLLIKSRRELAQKSVERQELLTLIVTDEAKDLRLLETKRQRRENIGSMLPNLSDEVPAQKAEKEKLTQELKDINSDLNSLESQLKTFKSIRDVIDEEQTKILKQIDDLAASAEKAKDKIIRPAAKLQLRLKLNTDAKSEFDLKKRFGFVSTDLVQFPEIIALHLFPSAETKTSVHFEEKNRVEEDVGAFTPDWSETTFAYQETALGAATLPDNIQKRRFPNELYFEQILSLFDYCVLTSGGTRLDDFTLPIRISFSIAEWADSNSDVDHQAQFLSHRARLSKEQWKIVSSLPVAQEPNPERLMEDPGDPSLYRPDGKYVARTFQLTLKRSKQTQTQSERDHL